MFNEDLDFLKNKAEELKKLANIDLDDLSYDDIMSEFGLDLKQLEEDMLNSKTRLPLGFVKIHPDAITPKYNYDSDSGFDLHSVEDVTIEAFGRALVPSGLSFDIKDGYEIQVRTKSGLAINQGLMVLNSPGTVDCFSEDMKILTIKGEKTINELNLNDVIFSFNEKTLEIEKDIITNIFNTEEQEIIVFETDNGILEVTPNSEVYTKRGLLLAKDVKENDEIIVFY
jgi:deoxyuridine 5'-triphosphate nucleotidohydrolase